MTKIDIFSGFLGAGKTTLIKKMIAESYKGQKLVLIENEFGAEEGHCRVPSRPYSDRAVRRGQAVRRHRRCEQGDE